MRISATKLSGKYEAGDLYSQLFAGGTPAYPGGQVHLMRINATEVSWEYEAGDLIRGFLRAGRPRTQGFSEVAFKNAGETLAFPK